MMILNLISFLFVCWNNKVTAAGSVPSKNYKKQPLNDIWSPTASLRYSLWFTLIKIALYCCSYFFFFSSFFFYYLSHRIFLQDTMAANFQTINAVCDLSAVSRLLPSSYCALLSCKNTCIANFMSSHTSASFQHWWSGRSNESPAEMFAVMHLDLTITTWTICFALKFPIKRSSV